MPRLNACLGMMLLGLAALASCSSDGPDRIIVDETGLLTVQWSIEGTRSASLCAFHDVDAMELVIYDRFDDAALEIEAPCEAFSLTTELPPGVYYGEATLVGFFDDAATVTEPLEGLEIFEDTELVVEVAYPAGSFF